MNPDVHSSIAISHSLSSNYTEMTNLLLSDSRTSRIIALRKACEFGRKAVVSDLISQHLNKTLFTPSFIRKCVYIACSKNHLSIVSYLFDHFGYMDGSLNTAAKHDSLDVISYLLQVRQTHVCFTMFNKLVYKTSFS